MITTLQINHGIDSAQSNQIADIAEAHNGTCKRLDTWSFVDHDALKAIHALRQAGYVDITLMSMKD